jgi:hypothetical protein
MKKDLNQFELRHDSTSEGSSWPLISHWFLMTTVGQLR